jgi:peptide/nickel transport system ATP-binding protein
MLLSAHNLTKSYGPHRVLDDVSLTLTRGETLGLVGESGSGKSTLARILLRLIEPTSGRILYYPTPEDPTATPAPIDLLTLPAKDLRHLRRHISIVFQDPYAALNPRMSVRQILAEPFAIHHERPPEGLSARLEQLLAEVHLDPSALRRYPHEFSGGQRQRINIARALALRPRLLVLDEPVSALDVSVAAQVINLLRDLQARHNLTCLFISHSMPLVRYLCHNVAVMQHGRIVETGTWQQVCDNPTNPYTQQLLAATPELPTLA